LEQPIPLSQKLPRLERHSQRPKLESHRQPKKLYGLPGEYIAGSTVSLSIQALNVSVSKNPLIGNAMLLILDLSMANTDPAPANDGAERVATVAV